MPGPAYRQRDPKKRLADAPRPRRARECLSTASCRSALRAIYRDPVLNRYAIDPALPIRIVVDNGNLTLYGTVLNSMDKQVAGIRAGQIFGVFKVQNNLEVAKQS